MPARAPAGPDLHAATLGLLGAEAPAPTRSLDELFDWASRIGVVLPGAYLSWARRDDGTLLEKYSNDDLFWFEPRDLVDLPDGGQALEFMTENQNAFDLAVLLGQGDDPPVMMFDAEDQHWFRYAERFSDAIYAQIFDWQFWLAFPPESEEKELRYFGQMRLRTAAVLEQLRLACPEAARTTSEERGQARTQHRFPLSPTTRIGVSVGAQSGTAALWVAAKTRGEVAALEAEWLERLGDDVLPAEFRSLGGAASFLADCIEAGWFTKLRFACEERPTLGAVERLAATHRERTLRQRIDASFPAHASEHVIEGPEWPVTIRFRRIGEWDWILQRIT